MKKALLFSFIFLCLVVAATVVSPAHGGDTFGGLLSPGELAKAHAKYEGLSNCSLCHQLGAGVTNANCLDCHDKLAARLEKNEGYHSNFKKDRCIKCHLDHEGRDYKMVSLDEKDFDHDKTGLKLDGKHKPLKCNECHTRPNVYSGQVQECVSCHDDEHNKQLGRDCERCHTTAGFKNLKKFSHNRDSDFVLKGKHIDTKCAECHVRGRYKPLDTRTCGTRDCHGDKHSGQFKGKGCIDCHYKDSRSWKSTGGFSHSEDTDYELKGEHEYVKCSECHSRGRAKPDSSSCGTKDCHGDEHEGQFKKKTCTKCHDDGSDTWEVDDKFTHNDDADFELLGEHADVECRECHVDGRFEDIDTSSCGTEDCHGDQHKKQFEGKLCEKCHLDDYSTWKVKGKFDHEKDADFVLKGKHLRVRCEKCHEDGHYKPIDHSGCGTEECHGDKHKGEFDKKACTDCHTEDISGWEFAEGFDHDKSSDFKLEGRHKRTGCKQCHKDGKYRSLKGRCIVCHEKEDPHFRKLDKKCDKCHTAFDWAYLVFDHNRDTSFPLTRNHAGEIECYKCHIQHDYKETTTRCLGCHTKGVMAPSGGRP